MEQLTDQSTQEKEAAMVGRRQLLKAIAATGGTVALTSLPDKWAKPIIEVGVLPAHAQASPTPTSTPQPELTSTSTPQPELTPTSTPQPELTPTSTPQSGLTPTPPLGNKFAVMGTSEDGNKIIVLPNADQGLPNPTQNIVPGLPNDAQPHGVAYFGNSGGLVSDLLRSRVYIVDLATSTLQGTISTSSVGYNGSGTIAIPPGSAYALASGGSSLVIIIEAPFTATSPIRTVNLPGQMGTYQTQGIVFDQNRRAFVYTNAGISVLNPPYSSIDFTIPLDFNNIFTGAIAISPDGETILTTDLDTGNVHIFKAPFSASSTSEILTVVSSTQTSSNDNDAGQSENAGTSPNLGDKNRQNGNGALDGINITPDGTKVLVADAFNPRVYVISAPFGSTSPVEEIPLLLTSGPGFEDIGISADGQLAILTGNSAGDQAPAVFIQAPFTASEAKVFTVDIDNGNGRGDGAVRFQPLGT